MSNIERKNIRTNPGKKHSVILSSLARLGSFLSYDKQGFGSISAVERFLVSQIYLVVKKSFHSAIHVDLGHDCVAA